MDTNQDLINGLNIMMLVIFAYTMLVAYDSVEYLEVTNIPIKDVSIKSKEIIILRPEPPVLQAPLQPTVKMVVVEPEPVKVAPAVPKREGNAYLLAQIINAEAKGESYNGKVAVGNVVMNRVDSANFPNSIEAVIFQKGQFSPVSDGSIYNEPSSEALEAANAVLNGVSIVGPNALYFYNPRTATDSWIFTRTTIMDVGNHRFAY